jgi:hypothetical protein
MARRLTPPPGLWNKPINLKPYGTTSKGSISKPPPRRRSKIPGRHGPRGEALRGSRNHATTAPAPQAHARAFSSHLRFRSS